MKTQMEYAREGIITSKMQQAADNACIPPELLRERIALGTAIIKQTNICIGSVPLYQAVCIFLTAAKAYYISERHDP